MKIILSELTNESLKARILEADRQQNGARVRKLETYQSKRAPVQTLVAGVQKPKSSPSRVEICITLVQFRRRLLDGHDNLAFSCKPLVDAIAQSLRVDDGDKRLSWKYEQLKTTGCEGVAVKIDTKE